VQVAETGVASNQPIIVISLMQHLCVMLVYHSLYGIVDLLMRQCVLRCGDIRTLATAADTGIVYSPISLHDKTSSSSPVA